MNKAIEVFSVLLGLLVIVVLAAFVVGDSSHGGDFAWRQQAVIGKLNMPVLIVGAIEAVLVTGMAYQRRKEKNARRPWFVGAGLMIGAGMVTLLFIHPIDSLIMTWDANVPPADWNSVRERRILWYATGLILGVASLVAVAAATFFDRDRTKS